MPAPALEAPPVSLRFDDSVPVIVLPDEPAFEALRKVLRQRLPALLDAIGGRASRLDYGERAIDLFDLRRLVHLLKDEFDLQITGLYARPAAIHRFAERELKLKLFPVEVEEPADEPPADEPEPAAEVPEPEGEAPETEAPEDEALEPEQAEVRPAPDEEPDDGDVVAGPEGEAGRRTLYVQRTLRSGTSVRFEGDVVVMGDVNPGAQVVASGNILVLGTLKGLAHAGATGDSDAFLLAFTLEPTQIRIARKIAIPPERSGDAHVDTEIARIEEDRIVIEPYRSRPRL